MSFTNKAIHFAKLFGKELKIGFDCRDRIMASHGIERKDGCMLTSFAGYGNSVEEACEDLMRKTVPGTYVRVESTFGPRVEKDVVVL